MCLLQTDTELSQKNTDLERHQWSQIFNTGHDCGPKSLTCRFNHIRTSILKKYFGLDVVGFFYHANGTTMLVYGKTKKSDFFETRLDLGLGNKSILNWSSNEFIFTEQIRDFILRPHYPAPT